MPRGGQRANAGAKSTWNAGATKTIRVPIAIADKLLQIARQIDADYESSEKSNHDNYATIEPVTDSKVINLSGVSLRQVDGILSVYLEDLVSKGYTLVPSSIDNMVKSRIKKKQIDKEIARGNYQKRRKRY